MHHRLDGGHHGGAFFVITVVGLQSQVTINLIERIGAFTRDMSAINLGLAAILSIAVIWLYAQTRMQPLVIALAFVMVGGALGLNVQVLTGYDAQHWMHFTNRIIQPLFFYSWCGHLAVPAKEISMAVAVRRYCVGPRKSGRLSTSISSCQYGRSS